MHANQSLAFRSRLSAFNPGLATALASAIVLASCGYVGDPLPPALNIPGRITDLRVVQHADKIVITFTIPPLTTEGLALKKLQGVELRAGGWQSGPFNADAWTAGARLVEVSDAKAGENRVETLASDWTGREVSFRVRAVNARGRAGDWSDFAVLQVAPPLEKPAELRAEAVSEGVRLVWQGSQPNGVVFRVRRRTGEEKEPAVLDTATDAAWLDSSTRYGVRYEYSVQAVLKRGASETESEISDLVEITPEDRFPPAVPSGLVALAGPDSIELSWERNTEEDLAGYRLYRSVEGQPFQRIAEWLEVPSYSDRGVERGRRYRYAATSVDRLGNESPQSPAVEAILP